jgi:hypothetical protein
MIVSLPSHEPGVEVSEKFTVSNPLHASFAVTVAADGMASQETEIEADGVPLSTGPMLSSMVKVATVVDLLLHASVAVNVTVADPVAPQAEVKPMKSWVHETLPHASDARAPPLLLSQAFKAVVLPAPSHSTVRLLACVSMVGAVVSSIVNVAVVELLLPQLSVAVKVTVADPVEPQSSLNEL